jgi:hypothetical protein
MKHHHSSYATALSFIIITFFCWLTYTVATPSVAYKPANSVIINPLNVP